MFNRFSSGPFIRFKRIYDTAYLIIKTNITNDSVVMHSSNKETVTTITVTIIIIVKEINKKKIANYSTKLTSIQSKQ